MAIDHDLKELIEGALEMVSMLDSGKVTVDELRERALKLPSEQGEAVMAWIDLAIMLHQDRRDETSPPAKVVNPRYRKGTAMKPVAWSHCLWKPTR